MLFQIKFKGNSIFIYFRLSTGLSSIMAMPYMDFAILFEYGRSFIIFFSSFSKAMQVPPGQVLEMINNSHYLYRMTVLRAISLLAPAMGAEITYSKLLPVVISASNDRYFAFSNFVNPIWKYLQYGSVVSQYWSEFGKLAGCPMSNSMLPRCCSP